MAGYLCLCVRVHVGGGGCSRRRRDSQFFGLFYGLEAFSGFLGGDGQWRLSSRLCAWCLEAPFLDAVACGSHF